MSELNFFAFCITVIALTAISYGKDKIAEKALSALGRIAGDFSSAIDKIVNHPKTKKHSKKL